MPLYDYLCPNCGEQTDVWARVDEDPKLCGCGLWMKRLISATRSNPDWMPYFDDNLGQYGTWVESRQHRKRIMGELGLVDNYTSTTRTRWV
jgi:putative FmdB family regulatory protein